MLTHEEAGLKRPSQPLKESWKASALRERERERERMRERERENVVYLWRKIQKKHMKGKKYFT